MPAEPSLAESGDLPRAVAEDSAQAPLPGGLPNFDRRQRAALRAIGRSLLTAGQYAQARAVFAALLHLDPTHLADLAAAAEAFQAEGKPAQAASLLQVCLLLGGREPDIPLRLAECQLALGYAPAARIALDLAEEYAVRSENAMALARIALMRNGMVT